MVEISKAESSSEMFRLFSVQTRNLLVECGEIWIICDSFESIKSERTFSL